MSLQELYFVSGCLHQGEKVYVLYNGWEFEVKDDNQQEKLLGIWDDMVEEVYWVRIENCLLPVGSSEEIAILKNESKRLLDNFLEHWI